MNVLGLNLIVLASTDHSKVGRTGTVVLDTSKTLILSSAGGPFRVEKAGNVFRDCDSKSVFSGADITGRLEDRWGLRSP